MQMEERKRERRERGGEIGRERKRAVPGPAVLQTDEEILE